jgi:hypothetical protein
MFLKLGLWCDLLITELRIINYYDKPKRKMKWKRLNPKLIDDLREPSWRGEEERGRGELRLVEAK